MSNEPSETPAPSQRVTRLYAHEAHPHTPRHVNTQHRAEVQQTFNLRLAVWLTKHTGTMACAYVFAGIGIGSLIGVITNNGFLAALFGSLSSYFLQLVFLPVLQVGQNVLNRHAELQADEMFHTTQRTLHDIEQVTRHLEAQDAELLRQTALLVALATGKGLRLRDPQTGRFVSGKTAPLAAEKGA